MVQHLKHLIWVEESLWFIKGQLVSLMFYHHIKVIKLIIFCSSERYLFCEGISRIESSNHLDETIFHLLHS